MPCCVDLGYLQGSATRNAYGEGKMYAARCIDCWVSFWSNAPFELETWSSTCASYSKAGFGLTRSSGQHADLSAELSRSALNGFVAHYD